MRLDELLLTPKKLVNTAGQEFIEQAFCGDNWTENRYDITALFLVACYQQDKNEDFYPAKDQKIAQFPTVFAKEYSSQGQGNEHLSMSGFTTTLLYRQDASYYEKAGYHGSEGSHYLIVPYVRFSVCCI